MDFDDEYWWDLDLEEIHVRGRVGPESMLFRLSQIAMSDHFGADDSRQMAEQLFVDNRGWFEDIATAVANDNEGAEVILITGVSCEHTRLEVAV